MDPLAQLQTSLAERYRVDRQIGVGGMATVYLARDLRHDRNVALKLLKPELGAILGADRFLSEIRVTANLQHPHLLPLFDSGEADGLLFYVMPYVEGESLRARLIARSSCRSMKPSALRSRPRVHSITRTDTVWYIAISSPKTSCCTMASRWSAISALRSPSRMRVVRG